MKGLKFENQPCLNCGEMINGSFCSNCGQRAVDNLDRSMKRLVGEFFGNIFFLDNRFFLSFRYLIRKPGLMTKEFLDGKRKKFISPVTLFLFVNLIYFIVNPLSDYSLSLGDQISNQPLHSKMAYKMVTEKIKNENLSMDSYEVTYQNASDNISKSIMIVNVPLIALFIFLYGMKKRKYYFDSLIFSFHFFSLFLLSWITGNWVDTFFEYFDWYSNSYLEAVSFILFTSGIPLIYAVISFREYLQIKWHWSILAGFGAVLGVVLAQLVYRAIIFFITFWAT